MSNNTITLSEVASKPMPLTEHGQYAYWYLRSKWDKDLESCDGNLHEVYAPNQHELNNEEIRLLNKVHRRVALKWELRRAQRALTANRDIALLIVRYMGKRKFFKSAIRKEYSLSRLIEEVFYALRRDKLIRMSNAERRRQIGHWFRKWEKRLLDAEIRARLPQEVPLCKRLPIYECSGELEASALRGWRQVNGKMVYTNKVRDYKSAYWDVGRDGGGQHEIRFRITQKLPEVACSLVANLGSIDRNGGHIHINVGGNEDVGRAVFFALRHHLSWFRYLAPLTRRRSRWCNVQDTMSDWESAKGHKYAAVSAAQFRRLGTIEVRLWPTTRKPSDWRLRASLMQAIAKWSDDHADCDPETPISNETAVQAWESFYRWAAIHDPSTLRDILKAMKSKARSINSRRNIDRFGAAKCDEFVRQFDASDTRLRGYRRVEREPVTAVCSTDQ